MSLTKRYIDELVERHGLCNTCLIKHKTIQEQEECDALANWQAEEELEIHEYLNR